MSENFQSLGKTQVLKDVFIMFVIIGTITGAESLITLVGILSIPGALFSGKEVIMFSTSEHLILSNNNCSEVG